MKQFIVFIFVISAISVVKSECEDDCSCPDLLSLSEQADKFLYTKLAGCVSNMTCPANSVSGIQSAFTQSEIVFSDHTLDLIAIMSFRIGEVGPAIDIYSFFGLICEGDKWYATKYPQGIVYYNGGPAPVTTGPMDELNGKKSEVNSIICNV